jgi:hypothetical protein
MTDDKHKRENAGACAYNIEPSIYNPKLSLNINEMATQLSENNA